MKSKEPISIIDLQIHLDNLSTCDDEVDIITAIAALIQPMMKYKDCIVLKKNKSRFFETIGTSNSEFYVETWPECNLFASAISQGSIISLKPLEEFEFAFLDNKEKNKIKNVYIKSINTNSGHSLFIFTNINVNECEYIKNSSLINIFFQQLFFSLVNMDNFQKQTAESFSLVHKFSQLSSLFKELASEWFWRTTPKMLFESVKNANTEDNIYEQVFVSNTIFNLRSKRELLQENKWNDFKYTIESHGDFHEFEFEICALKSIWVSLSGKSQFDELGNFIGYLGIAKDITSTKEREASLKEEKHKAIEASNTKSKFLTVMSHEIRTPMNAIMGMIELLLDTPLDQEQKQWLNYANSSADILYGLITDVLDFSKIESGTVLLANKPINIRLLIDNIVGQLDIIEKNEHIIFTSTIDDTLPKLFIGDEFRLSQVLFNIVGNALKFTKSGRITLKTSLINNMIVFEIADSGVGIAKKNLELIFQPFSQVNDSVNRTNEGVGLGLSISKNLIELMDGYLSVESQLGLGSTFKICIPFKAASNEEVKSITAKSRSSLSILVAEDNKTNQVLAKAFLEKLNHNVTLANNGSEALDLLKLKNFDLILMDIMMPVMDGLTATQHIRDKLLSDIPIYALTANAESNDKASCFKVGMNKVLTKPIKFEVLQAALNKFEP